MRYFRIRDKIGDKHLAVETDENRLTSLTSINEEVGDFRDLLRASYISGRSVDEIARHILSADHGTIFDLLSGIMVFAVSLEVGESGNIPSPVYRSAL